MSNDEPLIYFADGETRKWEISCCYSGAKTLGKAVAKLCKKLELPVPDVPDLTQATRFGLYYSPEHSPTNIMCGEEPNESLFGVSRIDFFEEGEWLIQYCPSGKSYFSNGRSFHGDSMAEVFAKFKEYVDKGCPEEWEEEEDDEEQYEETL